MVFPDYQLEEKDKRKPTHGISYPADIVDNIFDPDSVVLIMRM